MKDEYFDSAELKKNSKAANIAIWLLFAAKEYVSYNKTATKLLKQNGGVMREPVSALLAPHLLTMNVWKNVWEVSV